MLQQEQPDDYVIASGESHSLEEFVAVAFDCVGLARLVRSIMEQYDALPKVLPPTLDEVSLRLSGDYRPTDIAEGKGTPAKAKSRLGWQARYKMGDVVRMMVREEQKQ